MKTHANSGRIRDDRMIGSGLVGYSGFVGGNLLSQRPFDALYNSKNFRDMQGQAFGELVCAGVSAAKWKANQDPAGDRQRIAELEEVLATVLAEQFVLISTIDVYPVLLDVDESFDCHSQPNHAYGSNRLALEDFCRSHFANCCVVRLPGLFGDGLKKNIIFDLLHDNCLETINPNSSFQYYDLCDLWQDVQRVTAAGMQTANLFTEPLATRAILERFFPDKQVGQNPSPEAHYDLHTRHSDLWGRRGPYIASAEQVSELMAAFISRHSGRSRL